MNRIIAILYSLIFIFIISTSIYSQEIADGRFQLIKSEDFTKPIHYWLFPAEKSIISVNNEQITWRSDGEASRFTLPEDALKVIFSKGGNYFGIVRLKRVPQGSAENRKLRIEVYTANREKRYEIQRDYYYDDPLPFAAISDPDGSLIIGQKATGEIQFYNPNGSLIREIRLFDDTEYDPERTLHIDLSKDGSSAAMAAGKRGASPAGSNAPNPSAEPYLFLFSLKGEELWRKPLPDFNSSAAAISDDGQYIAANSYTVAIDGSTTKRTIIFDNTGNEIGQVDILFKQAGFSSDSKFLILADNTTATAFNLATGNISWSYTISNSEAMITAANISNNGEIAILLVAETEFRESTFIYINPQLEILNNSGNLLQELELTDQEFEKPAINVSDNSKEIFVGFRNTYQIYQVKE